jgi:hypothetical protein
LIESGTSTDDVARMLAQIQAATDPDELIRFLVHCTRILFEEWGDLMRQVVAAAAREPSVRESMQIAHDSMLDGLKLTARQLDRMGALRAGTDVATATDLLWPHLGNAAYFIRTDDLGWSLDRSEAWLNETLPVLLLGRNLNPR